MLLRFILLFACGCTLCTFTQAGSLFPCLLTRMGHTFSAAPVLLRVCCVCSVHVRRFVCNFLLHTKRVRRKKHALTRSARPATLNRPVECGAVRCVLLSRVTLD